MANKTRKFNIVFNDPLDPLPSDEKVLRDVLGSRPFHLELPGVVQAQLSDEEASDINARLDRWTVSPEVAIDHPVTSKSPIRKARKRLKERRRAK